MQKYVKKIIIKKYTKYEVQCMKLQQMMSVTRQAIDDFNMIEPKDRIAIGISGGKDSLALLHTLSGLQRYYPIPFELVAISVNLGFKDFELSGVQKLCDSLHIPFYEIKTEIGKIVFDERKEKNPCSLCAKMRKGALNQEAKRLGCTKVAYAHHKDDFIETAFLSLLFEGNFYVFPPKTYLTGIDLTVIRPFIYMNERDIIGFSHKNPLPIQKNPCPADGYTKREYVKNLLRQLNKEHPGTKNRIFHAILHSNLEGYDIQHEKK